MKVWMIIAGLLMNIAVVFSNPATAQSNNSSFKLSIEQDDILNQLSAEINANYGFRKGMPRINLGPCGPFAKDFYEQWNHRFKEKVNMVYIMLNITSPVVCSHILVRLPDGRYYDGGSGVMTDSVLHSQFTNHTLDERKDFNLKLLEENAGGLTRKYRYCPNYSNDSTKRIIQKYLTILSKTLK